MSPEKSQQLIDIYPELFSNPNPRMPFALFGFECEDGWFDILKDLITEIKEKTKNELFKFGLDDEIYPLRVDQIKEKYGTLRFYTNFCNERIDRLIRDAEEKSATTCEACGNPGSMRKEARWLSVRCDACWPKPSKWS